MYSSIKDQLAGELDEIRAAGLFKTERKIAWRRVRTSRPVRWTAARPRAASSPC